MNFVIEAGCLGGSPVASIALFLTRNIKWVALVEPPSAGQSHWTFRDVVDRGEGPNLEVALNNFIIKSAKANESRIGFCDAMVEIVLPALIIDKESILETLELEFMSA